MSFGTLRRSIIQTKQQHKNDRPREILRSVLLYQYGADFEQISFCKQRKNESNDIIFNQFTVAQNAVFYFFSAIFIFCSAFHSSNSFLPSSVSKKAIISGSITSTIDSTTSSDKTSCACVSEK